MRVSCGTSNAGKLREFQLAAPDFEIRAVKATPPEEHGATFLENARLKAAYYASLTGGWVFADDSGLEVDALAGAPGVHSARFAGPDANDQANNALLLDRLRGVVDRSARFVCVIALANDGVVDKTFRGSVEGRILEAPRGARGFGYDPMFQPHGEVETYGEMDPARKAARSHRARAFAALVRGCLGVPQTTD